MDATKRKSTVAERFGAANHRLQRDRGPQAVLSVRGMVEPRWLRLEC
jgi:hypothetical protein